MSADNYYTILPHPNGGFAAIMQFASDEHDCELKAEEWMESFPTLQEAESFARSEYTEYGVSIHPDCWAVNSNGIIFSNREQELLLVMVRSVLDEPQHPYFKLFRKELEGVVSKLES